MQLHAANQDWAGFFSAMAHAASPNQADESPAAEQLARARGGCNAARAALLREFEDGWYRLCLSMLGNADDARDATQETAFRVLRKLPTYRGDAMLRTWAYGIALNVCREQRRCRRWLALPAVWVQHDTAPDPASHALANEQHQRLYSRLARLPRRQREAVTLRYLHQMSTDETAQTMSCAPGTVKAALAKALRTLRQEWEQDDA